MKRFGILACAALSLSGAFATAAVAGAPLPVTVTQTTTGSAGNYTYDFTVDNQIGDNQSIYFFGVNDTSGTVSYGSAPSPFTTYGGFGTDNAFYNLAWIDDVSYTGFGTGQQLGGFTLFDTALVPQNGFSFFAYGTGDEYTGGGSTGGNPSNPLFEGTAVSAVGAAPEPGTWVMLIAGFGMVGFAMRRRPTVRAAIRFA